MRHLVAATLLVAGAAVAGEQAPTYDRVSLSAAAEERVANDTLVATLYVQREGPKQAAVADEVNTTMRKALESAKGAAGVTAQTGGYSTSPVYNRETIVGWRARQSLRLESRDPKALTALLGTLQETLAVESVGYDVSPPARRTAEDRLIAEALAAFRGRADLIAQELGRKGYRFVQVDVSSGGYAPPPMPVRAMAMKSGMADVAEPAIESGEQSLTVSVSGVIELLPE